MRLENLRRDDPFKNRDLVSVVTDPDGGCTLWIRRVRNHGSDEIPDWKDVVEGDYDPFCTYPDIEKITREDEDGEYSYWHTPLRFRKFVSLLKEEGWQIY